MLDLWGQRRPMRLNTWYDKVKWNDIFIFFGLMLLVGTANLVRESIRLLFNPLLDPARPVSGRYPPLLTAFVCAHGFLFTRGEINSFLLSADQFLSILDR